VTDLSQFDELHEGLIRRELDAMELCQRSGLPEQAREHWDNAKALLANRRPEYVRQMNKY